MITYFQSLFPQYFVANYVERLSVEIRENCNDSRDSLETFFNSENDSGSSDNPVSLFIRLCAFVHISVRASLVSLAKKVFWVFEARR